MKTTIDSAGRIVLPKAIREAADLTAGTEVLVSFVENHIRIEPAPLEVKLVKKGGFTVAVPKQPLGKLTQEESERIRRSIQQERVEKLRGI